METNSLVRFLDSRGSRRQLLSPYLLGLRGINNKYFLPNGRDLPIKGMTLRGYVFDFGFNPGSVALAPYQESDVNLVLRKNMLVWAVVGTSIVQPDNSAPTEPAYLFNIFHQHEDKTFQFFNKPISDVEAAGTAGRPYLLKEPQLILTGDQLQVDVQNTANVNLAVQVVLYGGEFD